MSAARAPAIDGARRFDNAASEAFFSTLELGVTEERIYLDPGLTGTNRARPGLNQALAAVPRRRHTRGAETRPARPLGA